MTVPHVHVAGNPTSSMVVHVPTVGPWFADVDLIEAPNVEGRVTLAIGALELVGTVDPSHNGTFGLQRRCRIVAGAGGWSKLLASKAYHNDAGVKALLVAQDAAREAGETIAAFAPASPKVGNDYVRESGPASRVLEDVIGDVPWWVAYDGTTHVGARSSSTAREGTYEVLDHEPAEHLVTLGVDDLRTVEIGSVLSDRLDEPQTVRELEIQVTSESVRVKAWCGGGGSPRGRLAGILRSIIERATDRQLFGTWRYRLVRMSGDRLELQSVRQRAGLPNILPIAMWPGVAGAHAQLTPGAEVLVEFLEGDRAQPIVTGFVGKGGPGFVPVRLTLGSTGEAPNAARQGDTVRVTIPANTFLVAAQAGVANALAINVDGTITSGSSKVGIG